MQVCIDRLREHSHSDLTNRIRFDHLFHYTIGRTARSRTLALYQHQILENLYARMRDYFADIEDVEGVIALHEMTLAAIRTRDPAKITAGDRRPPQAAGAGGGGGGAERRLKRRGRRDPADQAVAGWRPPSCGLGDRRLRCGLHLLPRDVGVEHRHHEQREQRADRHAGGDDQAHREARRGAGAGRR